MAKAVRSKKCSEPVFGALCDTLIARATGCFLKFFLEFRFSTGLKTTNSLPNKYDTRVEIEERFFFIHLFYVSLLS